MLFHIAHVDVEPLELMLKLWPSIQMRLKDLLDILLSFGFPCRMGYGCVGLSTGHRWMVRCSTPDHGRSKGISQSPVSPGLT